MRHSIVDQMSPSREQAPAVHAAGADVVVRAGAGTGKTRTLVARYLRLLEQQDAGRDDAGDYPAVSPRRIVAITFTQKAAREMRNRVRDEVRRYLDRPVLDPAERRVWLDLYPQLDAARISTIHGLCAEILRAHPAEARVDPRFEVLEEGQANLLRRQALDEALAWAASDAHAASLFALFGERGLDQTLGDLLRRRLDAVEVFARVRGEDLLSVWRQKIDATRGEALDGLAGSAAWSSAVTTLDENAASRPDDLMEIQRQAALSAVRGAALGSPAASLDDRVASLSRLGDVDLRGGRTGAWPGGADQRDDVKAALKVLRQLWDDHAGILTRKVGTDDEVLAAALPDLDAAFARACARYQALKDERDALDFDDLEDGALRLLADHEDVRARWQREVEALLVDEFQDTNPRQVELVTLLRGASGKLFLVGDDNQSIYRFRGADVENFTKIYGEIERGGGLAFPLDTSYRAHAALIDALNDVLRPVVAGAAARFAPLRPARQAAGTGFAAPHVELQLAIGTKSAGALACAARALAGRVRELVADCGVTVEDGGHARRLDFGDFAILCRASTSFKAYEDAFEEAGIPFLTVAGRGFYGRPEVRDVLNALAALADPADDLAMAGLLRSPAFAVSDAGLYLLREHARVHEHASLWDAAACETSPAAGEDGARLARVVRCVRDLHGLVGRTTAAGVLKAYLDATDYRAGLIRAGQARGARNLAKLLADAHASGVVGVGEFLEYVASLRDTGTREGEARATAEGAVQIMTVHAAKGLEFPVVVLGDITYEAPSRNPVLIDRDLGVLPPRKGEKGLPAVYLLGRERDRARDDAELRRLLYVAATRAREKLILNGSLERGASHGLGRPAGWLGLLAEAHEPGFDRLVVPADDPDSPPVHSEMRWSATPVGCTLYPPASPPLPAASGRGEESRERDLPGAEVWPLVDDVPPETIAVDSRIAAESDPPPQVWRVVPAGDHVRAPGWVIGSLVHEALAAWRSPADGAFDAWSAARARSYGITDSQQVRDAVDACRELLERFRRHALFAEMDGAERRLHEVPYSLEEETGILDALFLRDGRWTVVEFKTDEVRAASHLAMLLASEDYTRQVRRYAEAVERLLGQRPRAVLVLLNQSGAVGVHPVPL